MDFMLKTITSHFFFASSFSVATLFQPGICFLLADAERERELVTVSFCFVSITVSDSKVLTFRSIFLMFVHVPTLFYFLHSCSFFLLLFTSGVIVHISLLSSEWKRVGRERNERKKIKQKRSFGCRIFGILCLAALKTNFKRQFYVWKQQFYSLSFFFFFSSVTRILCLFQIVLYYLFIFDFVLWRRTREHLLLKCVHSVAAFFFPCEFRVRTLCWFFGWMAGMVGKHILVRMSDTTAMQL